MSKLLIPIRRYRSDQRARNGLESGPRFGVGYTLARHAATHGWWQTIAWEDYRWLLQKLAMVLEDHRLARRAGVGSTRTRRDTWDDSMGRLP